jgi:hypothetical protein
VSHSVGGDIIIKPEEREVCGEKVDNIFKYQGEHRWPTVHNCSRLEHFPIYFGVYSSKGENLN